MKGHQELVRLRLRGRHPGCVWVDVDTDAAGMWRDWHQQDPDNAHVMIEPSDSIQRLDLRWAIGMHIMIMGHNADRVHGVVSELIKARAKRVVGPVMQPTGLEDPAWEVAEHIDTAGVLSWN